MVDGRPYTRTQVRKARPFHKPQEAPNHPGRCAVCMQWLGWVVRRDGETYYRRHYPGTFWEAD